MERREFLTGSGTFLLGIGAAQTAVAQSSFAYGPPITGGKLEIPRGGKLKVAFAVGPGVQVIDLAGPWEVFQDVIVSKKGEPIEQGCELFTVAEGNGPLRATGGLMVTPNYSIERAPAAHLVVIPHFASQEISEIHHWIRESAKNANLVMSICTGAFQLAKTGLIDGLQATTNQSWYDRFEERFPRVKVMRGPRFVEDGKFATSGGLTAGIDLALRTVDRIFGRELAQETADGLEYVSPGWRV